MATRLRRFAVPLIGLTVAATVLAVERLGVLDELEAVAMDTLMRLRGPRPADPRIVICDVDARSVQHYGLWPWPRSRIARLIDNLAASGTRVIALDVMFGEAAARALEERPATVDRELAAALETVDRELAAAIARAGNVVLGYFFRRGTVSGVDPGALDPNARLSLAREPPGGFPALPERPIAQPNLPLFAEAARAQGFFSNERRRGVLRHYDLVVAHRERAGVTARTGYYPALALQAVRLYLDADVELGYDAQRVIPVLALGERRVVTDEGAALWINYRGLGSYPRLSAYDVIEGRLDGAARARLDGALVFIGASEVGIGDVYATPFGAEVPGVEIHAHVADNLLNGDYVVDGGLQRGLSYLALFAVCLAVAWLVAAVRRHLVGSLLAITLVALWPLTAYLVFVAAGWHLQTVAPILGGVLALVVALRYQVGYVEARRHKVESTFRHYVSPAVVDDLLAQPGALHLGGELRAEMTVLFCDISGFTTMAEALAPEQVVNRLNEFFTPMTRVVLDAGGTLDKYMGDALMAFFGAPARQDDHAARACRAALAMSAELDRLNARWQADGTLRPGEPGLGMGVGLSSGPMVVGNMGSEAIFDYTVLGDPVNLGSRVEGLTRRYRCRVLATDATRRAAGDGFLFRELDRVQVKGKHRPVAIYELLAALPADDAVLHRAERFAAALDAYRRRDFAAAASRFEALLAEAPDDGPAAVLLERCRGYQSSPPPAEWQAMETLTTK